MTLADEVLRGLSKQNAILANPEQRMDIAQAIGHVFTPGMNDADSRDAIKKAAEALLGKATVQPNETASDNIGEIYVFNIIWITRGAVFATETHHISFDDTRDERDIEDFLVLDSKSNFRLVEQSSWVCITNNVAFDALEDAITVRFLGRRMGQITEIGRFNVANMRQKISQKA
jgi:hypothetical protein